MVLRLGKSALADNETLAKLDVCPLAIPLLHEKLRELGILRPMGLHKKATPIELYVQLYVVSHLKLVLAPEIQVGFSSHITALGSARLELRKELNLPLNPWCTLFDLLHNSLERRIRGSRYLHA